MKRTLLIVAIVIVAFVGIRAYNSIDKNQRGVSFSPTVQAPGGNGDVNADVCVGSKEFCQGVADAKKQALDNANQQYILSLTAMAPAPAATPSPEDLALQQKENAAKTNVLVVALWAAVVIGILYAVMWGLYQLYWHYRVKIPQEEVAPDIRAKDGLIVARIPGNPRDYDSRDQYMVVDARSFGTQIVHIDGAGIAHQLKLSDYLGSTVAMSHAIADAGSRDQARQTLATVLDKWNEGVAKNTQSLADFAIRWRAAGHGENRSRPSPSMMKRLQHGQGSEKKSDAVSDRTGGSDNTSSTTTTTPWQ